MIKRFANRGWYFHNEYTKEYEGTWSDGGEEVSLPHSARSMPFHFIRPDEAVSSCVYQKRFSAPEDWRGKRVFLTFGGAAGRTQVFFNGTLLHTHGCSYTPFSVELSDHIAFDYTGEDKVRNLISVVIEPPGEEEDPVFHRPEEEVIFGGLYRDVWFEIADPVYMTEVFYKPSFSESPKTRGMLLTRLKEVLIPGSIATVIRLSEEGKRCALQQRLFVCQFLDGKQISNQPLFDEGRLQTLAGKVHLWDVNAPYTYEIRTELRLDGQTVDTHTARIGFRDVRFRNDGMQINGRLLMLRGMSRYQCFPYTGWAMPKSIQAEDAEILHNELGLNAVRTVCGCPSEHFLDACDRIGLLVCVEIPFPEREDARVAEIVRSVLRSCRNHPSVFLWGFQSDWYEAADPLYRSAVQIVSGGDPGRAVMGLTSLRKKKLTEDIYAYRTGPRPGGSEASIGKPQTVPDRGKAYLLGSYCGSEFPVRMTDPQRRKTAQVRHHGDILDAISKDKDILGGFGSNFTDHYAADASAGRDGISYHGVSDLFRNPKPAAYVYAAQTNRSVCLALASEFCPGDLTGGIFGEQYILTNADSVRMYRGDRLIKEFESGNRFYPHMRGRVFLIDDYIGQAISESGAFDRRQGELIQKALNLRTLYGEDGSGELPRLINRLKRRYGMGQEDLDRLYESFVTGQDSGGSVFRFEAVQNGEIVARLVRRPFERMSLQIRVGRKRLTEDETYDMAAVRIAMTDQDGNVLMDYDDSLRIETRGPVTVVGPTEVPMRGGVCGTYLKTCGESGTAYVSFQAPGAKPERMTFEIETSQVEEI